jgi:tetratricopeptide (TPR) repeat protein
VENKLPLDWREIHQSQAIEHYASSLIGLNASMNGDLNMRTFEILAGGALLLTDRLAPASGLYDILKENHEFVTYDTVPELVEHARYLLDHPTEAQAIADAGAQWFRVHFNEKRRREAFLDLALNGRDLPEFELPSRNILFTAKPSIGRLIEGYHWLQVRHQKFESVSVHLDSGSPAYLSTVFATLPRVSVSQLKRVDELADVIVTSVNTTLASSRAQFLWLWDADEKGPAPSTVNRLLASGWKRVEAIPFLFTSETQKAQSRAATLIEQARELLKRADNLTASKCATLALKLEPDSIDVLLMNVELCLEAQNWEVAEKMLDRAKKINGAHPQIPLLCRQIETKEPSRHLMRLLKIARLAYDCRDYVRTRQYAGQALIVDKNSAEAHQLLGLVGFYHAGCSASQKSRIVAVDALNRSAELDPRRTDYQLELALACHEIRRFKVAVDAYRRALELEPTGFTWACLGRSFIEMGLYKDAIDSFRQGLALEPSSRKIARELFDAETHPNKESESYRENLNFLREKVGEDQVLPQELAKITEILNDLGASEKQRSLRLCACFAEVSLKPPAVMYLPKDRTLLAYQPWFGIDAPSIVSECLKTNRLIVLFNEETRPSSDLTDGIHESNFRTLTHRGVNLWLVSRYRLAVILGKSHRLIDAKLADDQAALRGHYAHAVALIDKAYAYFDCYRPESVIIAQGYDTVSAVLRQLTIARGLRVICLENIFQTDRLLWEDTSGVVVNQNLARNYFWRYRDFVSDEVARRSVNRYRANLKGSKSDQHASPLTRLPNGPASALPTITYLAQVGVDSSVLFGLRGFRSQVDVITALAAYASVRPLRLVIKLHPKENPAFKDEMSTVRGLTSRALAESPRYAALRAELGERLIIDESNSYDTYDLIKRAQVCVTINSQAGLEAAIHDREVVLCGDAFYGSLGFTHEVTDAQSLEFVLDRILRDGLRLNHGLDAGAFYHIFTEFYCLPKTVRSVMRLLEGRALSPALPFTEPGANVQPVTITQSVADEPISTAVCTTPHHQA